MEQVKIQSFLSAYKKFNELLNQSLMTDSVVRDACIQRFKYTLDTCWKALKLILLEEYGIEANSPKEVIRMAFKVKLISNDPLWIQMIDDRNMTAHIYNENMANKIVSQFNYYDNLFLELIKRLNSYGK